VKPAIIRLVTWATLAALIVLMVIWIAPAVGTRNSACEQYPLTSGCR
jgi:hypothetical protein